MGERFLTVHLLWKWAKRYVDYAVAGALTVT